MKPAPDRSPLLTDTLLLTTALIWGFAFVAQRVGMEHVGPFTFNALRFLLGAVVLVPVALVRASPGRDSDAEPVGRAGPTRALTRAQWWQTHLTAGALAGLALFAAASLQQVGLVYTTAGNAGFITGLYVVLVPVLGLARRQRPGLLRWVAVAIAVAGLYLLSVGEGFTINPGDLYVLGSALFFAVHVQLIDSLAKRHSALWLSIVQYIVVGIASGLVAAATESVGPGAVRAAAPAILYGGIGSISIAYTLQVVAQRTAQPSHAAILLSLEGTFAAVGGWLILGELLSVRALVGCALILGGMVLSQLSAVRRRG